MARTEEERKPWELMIRIYVELGQSDRPPWLFVRMAAEADSELVEMSERVACERIARHLMAACVEMGIQPSRLRTEGAEGVKY
jgi:hypothetical protein